MQESRGQRDASGKGEVQPPRQGQGHDEHDGSGDDVWERHGSSKGDLVDAVPAREGLVPGVGDGGALEEGRERVGDAGGDDDGARQVDAGGECSVACREDPEVEEEDGTFGQRDGEAVEDRPGHEALGTSSAVWRRGDFVSAPGRGPCLPITPPSVLSRWELQYLLSLGLCQMNQPLLGPEYLEPLPRGNRL